MATTSVSYDGDGAQNDFTITYAYTAQAFIEVFVDAVLQVVGTDYDFLSVTVIRFQAGSIPPTGTANVELRRVTGTAPLVDWESGASILEADQDLADLQILHIVEELENNALIGMGKAGANWDAETLRITDVLPPVADTDVATKASIEGQVTAAQQSADDAAGHETVSSSNAISALASATLALSRANAALASAESIEGVIPISGLSQDRLLRISGATSYAEIISPHPVEFGAGTVSGVSVLDILLDNEIDKMIAEITLLDPVIDGADLYARMSTNGGISYHDTSDYTYTLRQHKPGSDQSGTNASANQILLAKNLSNVLPGRITIEIFPGDGITPGYIRWLGAFSDAANDQAAECHGNANIIIATSQTRITHLRLLFSTGNINGLNVKTYNWVVPS